MSSRVRLSTLDTATVEQLQEEFAARFPDHRVPSRRAAIVQALRRLFVELGNEESESRDKEVEEDGEEVGQKKQENEEKELQEDFLDTLSFAQLKALAATREIKARSKDALKSLLREAGVTAADVEQGAAETTQAAAKREREEQPRETAEVAKKGKTDELGAENAEEKPKKKGRRKNNKDDDEDFKQEDRVEAANKRAAAVEDDADWAFADLKALAKNHKVKPKSKKAIIEALRELNVDIGAELEAQQKIPECLPFDSIALLCASANELKDYGKAVGAKSRQKDDLLLELRDMLPDSDRWDDSSEGHADRQIPGTNSYGNIDVRHGVPDGCKHVRVQRAGPTARAHGIPSVPAMVGFNSFRGQFTADISGIVIFKKDYLKLSGYLAARSRKKRLAQDRAMYKYKNEEDVPATLQQQGRAWTFADLPAEMQANLRDFSTLPRDCWIAIFKYCDASDVISCGRVCKGLLRISKANDVWQAKLFSDFSVCAAHAPRSQHEARALYLEIASSADCKQCEPTRECVRFPDIYLKKTRDWLKHSTCSSRDKAFREACSRIPNCFVHPTSRLHPAFVNCRTGDRSAAEVAGLMYAVTVLHSRGGYTAVSNHFSKLESQLHSLKFRNQLSWAAAVDLWIATNAPDIANAQPKWKHFEGFSFQTSLTLGGSYLG